MNDFDFKTLIEQEERAHKERVRQLKNRQKEYETSTSRMKEIREQMGSLIGEYRSLYDLVKKTSRRRRDQMEAAGFPDTPALLAELRSIASAQKEPAAEPTDSPENRPANDDMAEGEVRQETTPETHEETAGGDQTEWQQTDRPNDDGWNN